MRLCKHGVPINTKHDCDYVDERDALIPLAVQYADKEAGPRPPGTRDENPEVLAWVNLWNLHFHKHMDALWGRKKQERAA